MGRRRRIYGAFVKQFLKSLLEYRADFFIGVISFVILQLASLLLIFVVLQAIPELNGWNFDELVFIFGIYLIPRGIDHIFTDNLWSIGPLVRSGDFDRYLLRPIGTLFQIIAEKVDWNGFSELVMGIVVVIITWNKVDIHIYNWIDIAVVSGYILIGTLIYTFVKLALASLSFRTKNSFAIMASGYSFSEYAKYPITIYPKAIKMIIMYVLPFAFTSYFPAAYILGKERDISYLGIGAMVLAGLMIVATILWKRGIARYESAGS